MGWTVLYIAFGIVALWLLGEVLLQYKARLRWRLLAFGGFLGVVIGVLIPAVVVIALGAIAFAVGQTYVTLSFRRGFESGWAVRGPESDGGSKRRRGEPDHDDDLPPDGPGPERPEPGHREDDGYGRSFGSESEFDRDDVFTPARSAQSAAETTAVYEPQPMPDDTGSYGVYNDNGYGGQSQEQYANAAQNSADQGYGYDGYTGYDQQQYGYDATGQQQYAAYSDPYIGTQTYGGYDTGYGQYDQQQGYGQDQYQAGGYGAETPPGGVWVPQQRADDSYGGELPPEQQYPYQGDQRDQQHNGQNQQHNSGYDGQQYRF
ncbi:MULTISPECIES: hypothetical protein [Streptomyces]|uniref:Uncharacterized protein n=1 Tax=Streptomyces doudnae TaxID=3075536 RepID=A0ABD5ELM3_9ACTN|nr:MULTISPECIES: hypothetical protein [unclassified Streptomyces]MDT0435289.1 hypothetical protein [Streptomyces sp. DSM 41981]MYQ63501.1 hypothetical protein [Streptomyces sp. SID4950]SCD59514.1 hypothetical protein GA0115242_10967 [Streptomyces sp. SolWspMP-5a-2]